MAITVVFRHWLPFITICPVNGLPDLIYISVCMKDRQVDLYSVRRKLRAIVPMFKEAYMEDIAKDVFASFPDATRVDVRLAFNRHLVIVERE